MLYRVVRYYAGPKPNRTVSGLTGLTLQEAQTHCSDPESSYKTCKQYEGLKRTGLHGPWFDGYMEDRS